MQIEHNISLFQTFANALRVDKWTVDRTWRIFHALNETTSDTRFVINVRHTTWKWNGFWLISACDFSTKTILIGCMSVAHRM